MEPREANMLKPRWLSYAPFDSARPKAPLWEMKAMLPERGFDARGVVFRPMCGLMRPRQLGPTILMEYRFLNVCDLFFPSLPFGTGLPEAGRNDYDAFNPCLSAFFDD